MHAILQMDGLVLVVDGFSACVLVRWNGDKVNALISWELFVICGGMIH